MNNEEVLFWTAVKNYTASCGWTNLRFLSERAAALSLQMEDDSRQIVFLMYGGMVEDDLVIDISSPHIGLPDSQHMQLQLVIALLKRNEHVYWGHWAAHEDPDGTAVKVVCNFFTKNATIKDFAKAVRTLIYEFRNIGQQLPDYGFHEFRAYYGSLGAPHVK